MLRVQCCGGIALRERGGARTAWLIRFNMWCMIAWYYYSCLTGHQGKSCAAFEQTPSVSEIDEPGLWNGHQPINGGRIAVQSVYAMPINVERICNTWHDAAATLSTLTPAVDCLSHTVRNEKLRPGVLRCCTNCAVRMGHISTFINACKRNHALNKAML